MIFKDCEDKFRRSEISGWLRQVRYRSRKANRETNAQLNDVIQSFESHNYDCTYCDAPASTLDLLIPIKEGGCCVTSNVVLSCKKCKELKGSSDIIQFYKDGHLSKSKLLNIIETAKHEHGGQFLTEAIKKLIPKSQ